MYFLKKQESIHLEMGSYLFLNKIKYFKKARLYHLHSRLWRSLFWPPFLSCIYFKSIYLLISAKFPVQCIDQAADLFAKICLYVVYLEMPVVTGLKDFFNKKRTNNKYVGKACQEYKIFAYLLDHVFLGKEKATMCKNGGRKEQIILH